MDRFADASRPLSLPPHPARARRPGFPLLATLAPVAAAGLLFAITRSPLSLAFAAIGPIVGFASMLDGVRTARRERRRATRERDAAIAALEVEIGARHAHERERAWRATPSLERLAAEPAGSRWLESGRGQLVVGSGTEPSSLRLEGEPFDARDRALAATATRLAEAPLLVGLEGGIGFVGPELLARAAARAAVARCAITGMPGAFRILAANDRHWSWVSLLPHEDGDRGVVVVDAVERDHDSDGPGPAGRGGVAVIAVAAERAALPPGLATVVHVGTTRRALVDQPGDPRGARECVPELLGERQARELAVRLQDVAARNALGGSGSLPARVELASLPQPSDRGRGTLAVSVGVGANGPVRLDLVQDGPHALVGGTTGSGKSEFLLAWLSALAAAFGPDRLGVLLVDFKGGAAFQPIARLPHVTGVVTDLDDGEALRAVQSLRAESRRRERMLREHGVRDIADLDDAIPLARLVIVVDEYQALIDRFAELGEVFADIAARGRSLGMHLILATQRPNGVVREQISANCRLRVCLRVLQPGDSRAVVGVAAAAEIPPGRPGRAVLDRGDGVPQPFQSAIADPMHLELVHAAHAGSPPAARPWLDPLPARIDLDPLLRTSAADGGIVFGMLDDPGVQRQVPAAWEPDAGPLLVAGVPGSGRSWALAAIAKAFAARHGAQAVIVLPQRRSDAWDLLQRLDRGVGQDAEGHGRAAPRLLVVDDLDRRFRTWPDEYRIAAEAIVEGLLRAARSGAWSIAASATRQTSLPAGVRDGFGATLLLRQHTRSDLVQLGGDPALWRVDDRPGAGQWAGLRVQCAAGGALAAAPPESSPPLMLRSGRRHALVTADPGGALRRLAGIAGVRAVALGVGTQAQQAAAAASGVVVGDPRLAPEESPAEAPEALVLVGDAESWSSAWQLWGAIRHDTTVLVHGGLVEFRALIRDRTLPPLLDPADDRGWVIDGGRTGRFVWPAGESN